jgi:hypothetical protein
MTIEIIIRDYRSKDAPGVVTVYRDSYNTLRKCKGGTHPDDEVKKALERSDKDILDIIVLGNVIVVAEVKETGEIAGIGAISNGLMSRCLNSTYSSNHFVKEKFQHGKAGVNVGSRLRCATVYKAKNMGFRKVYGYATPESRNFHKKFGAKFFSAYNIKYLNNTVQVNYYEFELHPSIWNIFRVEPYLFKLVKKLPYKVLILLGRKLRI